MANNRMHLVAANGERICLAKYYPNDGWKIRHTVEQLDECLEAHTEPHSTWGDTSVRLEYEDIGDYTRCPSCGSLIGKYIERDERSNGAALGEPVWTCKSCNEWFDEEELSTITENKT